MKTIRFLLIVLLAALLPACNKNSVPEDLVNAVDSICSAYVPVHAESLCDLSLKLSDNGMIVAGGTTNIPEAAQAVATLLSDRGVTFADSIRVLPDQAVAEKPWGIVTLSVCNMRSKPSHAAEMVTQALMGTPVQILDKRGGWLYVQTPDSYLGWTNDDAISEKTIAEMDAWKDSERMFYISNYGVITDMSGSVVSDIVAGCIVQKTGEKGELVYVILPDGREGEIKRSEAVGFREWALKVKQEPVAMIKFARSLVGSPYLWGGTSTKGLDCSGFVKTIYFMSGMILSRDASAQYLHGEEISTENGFGNLLPGDLLFFGRIKDGRKRIGHTGMYIGNTEVIHSSGMVKINSIDSTRVNYSDYLGSTFMGAKRFIGTETGKGYMKVADHNWYF